MGGLGGFLAMLLIPIGLILLLTQNPYKALPPGQHFSRRTRPPEDDIS